jgi:hypothetical protein
MQSRPLVILFLVESTCIDSHTDRKCLESFPFKRPPETRVCLVGPVRNSLLPPRWLPISYKGTEMGAWRRCRVGWLVTG